MSKRRAPAGGDDFDRILKFLAGLGSIAGVVLALRRFLR
jgi:hypothetical protein